MIVVALESSSLRMIFWLMILTTVASALPTYDQEDPFEMTVCGKVFEDDGVNSLCTL